MALEVIPDISASRPDRSTIASKFPQFLAALFATLSALAAGACLAWSSPVLPLLQAAGVLSETQASWVGSIISVGALLGAMPAGWLADRFGRKGVLVLTTLPMLCSWALVAVSEDVRVLCLGRVLAGFAAGLVSVAAPMYISEISEDSIRGTLGTFFQLQLTIGVLFVYVVGLMKNALYISLSCSSLPVLFICTFVWMPESPSYLVASGQKEAAGQCLQWLRGLHYNTGPEMDSLRAVVSRDRASPQDLLRDRGTCRALLICLGLMLFQQLSGVNPVIFYSQAIFQAVGNSVDPTLATILIGVVQVLATYSSTVLIERAGRRGLLLLSGSTMSLCLAVVGLFFFLQARSICLPTLLPLVFLAVFMFVFSLGFGPVPWVVIGELFPDSLKGVSSALAASVNWSCAFAVTFVFNILKSNLGYGVTFWIFCAFCIAGSVFVAILLPETKGKDIKQIQDELRGERGLLLTEDQTKDVLPPIVVTWKV